VPSLSRGHRRGKQVATAGPARVEGALEPPTRPPLITQPYLGAPAQTFCLSTTRAKNEWAFPRLKERIRETSPPKRGPRPDRAPTGCNGDPGASPAAQEHHVPEAHLQLPGASRCRPPSAAPPPQESKCSCHPVVRFPPPRAGYDRGSGRLLLAPPRSVHVREGARGERVQHELRRLVHQGADLLGPARAAPPTPSSAPCPAGPPHTPPAPPPARSKSTCSPGRASESS